MKQVALDKLDYEAFAAAVQEVLESLRRDVNRILIFSFIQIGSDETSCG